MTASFNKEIGQRYGRLVVTGYCGYEKSSGKRLVRVLCDCGNEKIVRLNNIKGTTRSCGCLKAQIAREHKAKPLIETGGRQVYNGYKKGAIERGLELSITPEQLTEIIQKNCYYCASPPSNVKKYRNNYIFIYNGLDRLQNEIGYTLENVVPCCWRCNRMKHTLNQNEFIKHISNILENLGVVQKGL